MSEAREYRVYLKGDGKDKAVPVVADKFERPEKGGSGSAGWTELRFYMGECLIAEFESNSVQGWREVPAKAKGQRRPSP